MLYYKCVEKVKTLTLSINFLNIPISGPGPFQSFYFVTIKTAFKKRGFLCGYKPLLPARVSRRCFHFVQAIAFDSRQPSKGFIFFYFFLFAFSCLYACCSASENGFAYSFTLILSIAISCISCSRIYFSTVASFNPTVLT